MAKLKRQFNVLVERDEDGYFVASVPLYQVATRKQKLSWNLPGE